MPEKIMLLDGHSLLNRAFYGLPDLTNARGQHTNAVLGFLNIMLRYMEEEKPTHLLAAFDRKEPTFRHKVFKEYKGTRKPMPKELHEQVPLVKDVLTSMEIPVVTQASLEADDILGTIAFDAEKEGFEVVIVSGDRDLLQLATEKIKIKMPRTRGGKTTTEDYFSSDVQELYGVTPVEFIDMKGLMGDASDNIPGVPGIGEKTAAKIIGTWHSIENAYTHIDEIKPAKARNNLAEYYDLAILSKNLATIKTDCDLDYHFRDARIGDLFNAASYQICKDLELKSLLPLFGSEHKENDGVEADWIHDPEEIKRVFSEAEKAGRAGLGIVGGPDHIRAFSLTFMKNDKVYTAVITGPGGEDLPGQILDDFVSSGTALDLLDYKALIAFAPAAADLTGKRRDTGIMAYLLNPLQSSYDYDDIARDYLMVTLPSRKEICGKKELSEVFDPGKEEMRQLAASLSYVPFRAAPVLEKHLEEEGMLSLFREIEMPMVPVLAEMERCGIRVEKEALQEYGRQLSEKITALEKEIYRQAGKEFNINSPKQLGVILFEEMKMPFAKKTKTGYSTSADILDKLAPDYPFVSDILEYRQLTKLKSTYADGLAAYINEDGRIHGKFHQKVTATGRLSSSDPNLQNIPIRMPLGREIRKVFVPGPGHVFVSADYSQIELRVLAHMAGDESLIEAYRHDQDIHRITASQVFGVPLEDVTPDLRRNAKAVNFGIVYGISAFGLSQDLGITRKEAQDYIEKYFATYPGIKNYLDANVAYAREKGYVKTLYGRIRPIPELSSSNFMQRSFGERAAMNSSIQGTAADIIKIAMIRVSRRLKEENLESRLILQIHDELLIEAKEEEKEEVRRILEEEMMGAADLQVALVVDVSEGKNWYEAK